MSIMGNGSRGIPGLAALVALLVAGFACNGQDDDDSAAEACQPPENWTVGEVVDTEGCGVLAAVDGSWGDTLWVVRVEGSDYDMGYQYGRLTGPMLLELWWAYIGEIGEELGASTPEDADAIVGGYLDKIWGWFEPHLPQEQLDMLQGAADGMAAAGAEYGTGDIDELVFIHRLVGFAELAVSAQLDGNNILGLVHFVENGYSDPLLDYYGVDAKEADEDATAALLAPFEERVMLPVDTSDDHGWMCSSYAAWGDATEDGGLYGVRNMDFSSGTGIYKYGSIAVFVPEDGHAYASISWLGLNLGALAGINEHGVTIAAAQASTPLERLDTESLLMRGSSLLRHASDLDEALPFMEQAPSIGTVGVIGWGDPLNGGANAQAAAFEMTGASVAFYRHNHDCTVEERLIRYDFDGNVESELTHSDDPWLMNHEADAVEIGLDAVPRYFQHDGTDFVLDENDHYIEVATAEEGEMLPTGYTLDCAVYRGDPAMAHGVHVQQAAANGPMDDDGTGLMQYAGSWHERYKPYHDITDAYINGTPFTWRDAEIVPDNGGQATPVGLDQVEVMSRAAAMESSNVWDALYDATNLKVRISFETGTEDDWIGAHEQPPFTEIDMKDIFLTD